MDVETDQKPLEMILKKPLYQAPIRLQKLTMAIHEYSIIVAYRPGKELVVAYTLSRAFLSEKASDLPTEQFDTNTAHIWS